MFCGATTNLYTHVCIHAYTYVSHEVEKSINENVYNFHKQQVQQHILFVSKLRKLTKSFTKYFAKTDKHFCFFFFFSISH